MYRKLLRATMVAMVVLIAGLSPASAVTDGWEDDGTYDYVGLMVAFVGGEPAWRCSGTLISPWLFLTAGHCTYGADHVEIWFGGNLEGDPSYPWEGDVDGVPYTHPAYNPDAFFLADLGMVALNSPWETASGFYGALPDYDQLDAMKTRRGQQDTTFTAVGYGLQASFPDAAAWKNQAYRIRMVSRPQLIQINTGLTGTESLILSNNANTGGTCFGDSGGPNFIGDTNVIGGVTSFGLNGNCAGTGGVYRVDRADDLDWINSFFQ